MKRVILILAVLAGAALAFVLCGGVAFVGQVAPMIGRGGSVDR